MHVHSYGNKPLCDASVCPVFHDCVTHFHHALNPQAFVPSVYHMIVHDK